MSASVTAVVRELCEPHWPTALVCASSVPLGRSSATHTEAGQRAALHALSLAGCDVAALPPRTGRRPAWPIGFVGSIAHDDALAVAVAARTSMARTVGIDVEHHDALGAGDAYLVLSGEELEFVSDDPSAATLLWSAKESAYKAWCTGLDADLDRVDPRDIYVEAFDSPALQVRARGALSARVASVGPLHGRWLRIGDLVITLVWKLEPAAS